MKRIILFALAIAGLALTGCQRERVENSRNGETVTARFTVAVPGLSDSKAVSQYIADGTKATELLFRAYDASGRHLENLDQTVTVSGRKAEVSVKLLQGAGYKLLFWAQAPGKYAITHDADGQPQVSIASTELPGMMNSDDHDAFYAVEEFTPQGGALDASVSLRRAFAQLNVGVNSEDYYAVVSNLNISGYFESSLTIKGVPGTLHLFTGEVSGQADVNYNYVKLTDSFLSDGITDGGIFHRRLAMVYVFAPATGALHDVGLDVKVMQEGNIKYQFHKDVPGVPLKRNYRTDILGRVFTVTGTLSVQVRADFGTPDNNLDLTPAAPLPEPEAVDLGLPSGTKWASFNVGATKPEEYGNRYAWGETEVKADADFKASTYKWGVAGNSQLVTRYCPSDKPSYWGDEGTTPDGKTSFKDYDYADDAARQYYGGDWRTPTPEEWQELLDNCSSEWTTQNNVNGRLFISYYNSKSIFLPAAGYFYDNMGGPETVGTYCWYWSSSVDTISGRPNYAVCAFMRSNGSQINTALRGGGAVIRAVTK